MQSPGQAVVYDKNQKTATLSNLSFFSLPFFFTPVIPLPEEVLM